MRQNKVSYSQVERNARRLQGSGLRLHREHCVGRASGVAQPAASHRQLRHRLLPLRDVCNAGAFKGRVQRRARLAASPDRRLKC
jgi:hypothetical protein